MKKNKVAVFGATSHIAKGLIHNFIRAGHSRLHLYSRTPGKVRAFLASEGRKESPDLVVHADYGDLRGGSCDVLINCVGVGTLKKLRGDYSRYFTVTEEYDNLAVNYLSSSRPDALYISFSSGAVYGKDFTAPAGDNTPSVFRPNHLSPEDYYAVARLNAEAKHRSFGRLRIADLRVFSYFSRFIDLADGYFMSELAGAVLKKKTFVTDSVNIVRDYVHPRDLFSAVTLCMARARVNGAFDICSSAPVCKQEILDHLSAEYGLKYRLAAAGAGGAAVATGAKNVYCSASGNAAALGYKPSFSSMETIKRETRLLLRFGQGASK